METNEQAHTVYILRCNDGSLYTGYTVDLEHRIEMHARGKGAKYTRRRGTWQVMYVEKFSTKEKAMQREHQIKQLTRKGKFQLIREKLKEVMQNEDTN